MESEYRQHYQELFEKHWWWRARTEFIVETLERLRPPGGWPTILDVGCGEGLFFDRLSTFGDVEGVEVEEALQPDTTWRDRIHTQPFDDSFQPGKRYSLILMLDVLEHLVEPDVAVRTAGRLLGEDGIFLATVPAFQALWTNHDVLNHHLRRYTKATLRSLIASSGLQVRELEYFFHWTFPTKMLVRLYERVFRSRPEVPQVPPAWMNQSLYALSRIEQRTARWLPLPFGSSLMVVARRVGRAETE